MDYFGLLAECSVALGGFAAVHAVLRGSTGPRGTYRAWGSVAYGFTALLMSLAPLLLAAGEELGQGGWRRAGALGLLPCAACFVSNLFWNRRLDQAGHPPQVRPVLYLNWALHSLAIVLLLGTLVGWPGSPGWGAYASATTLLLVNAVLAIVISFWLAMDHALEASSKET